MADGMVLVSMMVLPVPLTFDGKERKAIPFVLVNARVPGFPTALSERLLAEVGKRFATPSRNPGIACTAYCDSD